MLIILARNKEYKNYMILAVNAYKLKESQILFLQAVCHIKANKELQLLWLENQE